MYPVIKTGENDTKNNLLLYHMAKNEPKDTTVLKSVWFVELLVYLLSIFSVYDTLRPKRAYH